MKYPFGNFTLDFSCGLRDRLENFELASLTLYISLQTISELNYGHEQNNKHLPCSKPIRLSTSTSS